MKKTLEKLKMNQAIKYITKWLKYNVKFTRAIPFISVLILVHSWIEYALIAILITHLTNSGLHLPKAASIVNVHDGVTAVLVVVVAYASDACFGRFKIIVWTNVAYIIGLVLLFLAAWRLHKIEIPLIYVALMFIALGRAGRDPPLKDFLADQFRQFEGEVEDEDRVESRRKIPWRLAYILGVTGSIFFFTKVPWVELFKICAIALAIAFTIFLCYFPLYECNKPTESSSLNKVVQVFRAAISNSHLSHDTLSSDHDPPTFHIPMIRLLSRWLHKAAIAKASPDEEEDNLPVCMVEQVHEVKLLLKMIPLWTTLLAYGLLQATGNTFFYEQADYMDNSLGQISHIPVVIFVIIKSSTSFIVSRICDLFLFPFFWPEPRKVPRLAMLVRIGIGLALSPVCCVIAWRIEDYRKQQYFFNDNNEISVFWLVPQFFLLGFIEGLLVDGMEEFFDAEVPKSFKKYGQQLTNFSLNIGNFLGIPLTIIFQSFLNDDLDTSRLGAYYVIIAGICFLNLMFYCYIAYYYAKVEEPPAAAICLEEIRGDEEQVEISVSLPEAPC